MLFCFQVPHLYLRVYAEPCGLCFPRREQVQRLALYVASVRLRRVQDELWLVAPVCAVVPHSGQLKLGLREPHLNALFLDVGSTRRVIAKYRVQLVLRWFPAVIVLEFVERS